MNPPSEQELLDALRVAEQSDDLVAIEQAVSRISLFYTAVERFSDAAHYWQKGALLLARTTGPDSSELATHLLNMATLCLVPGGMLEQARSTLVRAQEIFTLHFGPDAAFFGIQRHLDEIRSRVQPCAPPNAGWPL